MPLNEKALQRRIKQHIYAKPHRFFAVFHPGFESAARAEIESIVPVLDPAVCDGGLEFSAEMEDLWRISLSTRCTTRILLRLSVFRVLFWDELRAKAAAVPWEIYINPDRGMSFSVTCHHSKLYHTGRIEQELIAAVSERFLSQGYRGTIAANAESPVKIFVRFQDDICALSLDTSGEPLYRRGYKTDINEAPLRETLAASILLEAGVNEYDMLLDPMCGSGTIPIEGAMHAAGLLPGMNRGFAFETFPCFPDKRYAFIKKELENKALGRSLQVFASDIDEKSLSACRANAERAGVTEKIDISQKDFFSSKKADYPAGRLLIAMNPPYGERLGPRSDIGAFFSSLGGRIRSSFPGCGFAVIVPGEEAERAFGLRWDRKIVFSHGGLKVALLIGRV